MKNTKKAKKPFFTRYLEKHALEPVAGGATQKYPSDKDEFESTLKYPSDGDEI